MKKTALFFLCIQFFCLGVAYCADSATIVDKGNSLYRKEKYDEALSQYEKALKEKPDTAEIYFNIGAAQFKKKEFEKATHSFQKALLTDNKSLEEKANYNLGNTKFKIGEEKEASDMQAAIKSLEESLGNYLRAMDLKNNDKNARFNYEITAKKLKKIKEAAKEQSQQQNNQKKESSEGQSSQGESQKKSQENQEKKEPAEQQPQESQSGTKEENKQKNRQESDNNKGEQKKKEPLNTSNMQGVSSPEEPREMSEQEARMLLESFRQKENAAGKLNDKEERRVDEPSEDW